MEDSIILQMQEIVKVFPGVLSQGIAQMESIAPGRDPFDLRRKRRRKIHPDEGPVRRLSLWLL